MAWLISIYSLFLSDQAMEWVHKHVWQENSHRSYSLCSILATTKSYLFFLMKYGGQYANA